MASEDIVCECHALSICSFLNMLELCRVEAAGFNQGAVGICWNLLGKSAKRPSEVGDWLAPKRLDAASEKMRVLTLSSIHAGFMQVSSELATLVKLAKPLRLHVWPSHVCGLRNERTELVGDFPPFASASLSCHRAFGLPVAVGVNMHREKQDDGSAVYLGAQFARDVVVANAQPRRGAVTVLFAPFSGQCLMLHGDCDFAVKAQALPPVSQASQSVHVWLSTTESGALCFFRQEHGSNAIESCGSLEPEAFMQASLPRSSCQCKPCLYFHLPELIADVKVAVHWASDQLPDRMQLAKEGLFDAVWSIVDFP